MYGIYGMCIFVGVLIVGYAGTTPGDQTLVALLGGGLVGFGTSSIILKLTRRI